MPKLPNEDYKKLISIIAQIDSTAEATGYHSSNPIEFDKLNDFAWEELKVFCSERFEGVIE